MGVSAEQASDRLLTLLLDEVSATISYIGEAQPASSTSAAVWRIRKLDTTSGVNLLYADGNTRFDNIWDDRVSLTYTT